MKKFILFILTLAISSLVAAQHADYAGTWAGAMNRPAGLAGIEFTLTRAGDVWKGTMKMRVPNGELTPTVTDVQIRQLALNIMHWLSGLLK